MTKEFSRNDLLKKIQEMEAELDRYRSIIDFACQTPIPYYKIVQSLPIAALVIDTSHKVISCNRTFEKFTGISSDKILRTKNHQKLFYYKNRPNLVDLIVDQASEETIAKYYVDHLRKSNVVAGGYEAESYLTGLPRGKKWVYFTAAPIRDEENRLIGAIATLQDVSERKQSEYRLIESEKRLGAFFEFMPYPIVIFTRKGRVYYLNPAFTRKFGWRLDELKGKTIPWDPPDLEELPDESMETFFGSTGPRRFETKRLTKDGRIIDVIARGVSYSSAHGKAAGVLMVQRDVTKERREARNNEVIHKISLALPAYPDLRELLDFITNEVRKLTGSEVASTLLYDSDKNEMVLISTSHEDRQFCNNSKELRVPLEKLISRHVIETGEPLIENDLSTYGSMLEERNKIFGYQAKSIAMVPLISRDCIIGILSASNKKIGIFERMDIDLLNTIGSTVGLSIENAKVSKELQKAYNEVKSLNRAKDKLINHLSHEIKTPVAVLRGSIGILANQLQNLPVKNWQSALDRVYRNLNRIIELQNEVSDIVLTNDLKIRPLISALLDRCTDILETFVESQNDNGKAVVTLRRRIDELLGPRELVAENIQLTTLVEKRIRKLLPKIAKRNIYLKKQLESDIKIRIPIEVLNKVVDGLIRNAVENTPDRGTISVKVYKKGKKAILSVIDTGVGVREDSQQRIFEGFFTTRDIMAYSSKRPFDFLAGGKGADLLRMKIFSERYDFKIQMSSVRCAFIPDEKDICPGDIRKCTHCRTEADCKESGGSEFKVSFKPISLT